VSAIGAPLAAIFVLAAVRGAGAQCAFEHPKKAGKFQASLVSAFTGCGGSYCGDTCPTNAVTEGGIPACKPPETYYQQAGNYQTGWRWDETKGQGQVHLKPLQTGPVDPLNPPGDTGDIAVLLKMKGIVDALGPASGNGTLAMVARGTFDDRNDGDMTLIDFPAVFGFTMTGGKVKLKTTVDAALNTLHQPGLPLCSSVEVLNIGVTDANGDTFANAGLFLQ